MHKYPLLQAAGHSQVTTVNLSYGSPERRESEGNTISPLTNAVYKIGRRQGEGGEGTPLLSKRM